MALRSKRVTPAEDPAEVPDLPTESVTIELSDDDLDGLPLQAQTSEPPPASVEIEPEPEPGPDEAVRRAVEAQQRAEEIARTSQRERDEALRRERERQAELEQERSERQDAEYNGVLTSLAAEQATLARAKAELAAHMQAGDYTAAAEAQEAVSRAAARIDRLEDNKATFDQRRAAKRDDPPQRTEAPPQAASVEQKINELNVPDSAKSWLRDHPTLMSDPVQLRRLSAVHQYVTEVKGVAQFSQAYFDAVETELGLKTRPAPAPVRSDPEPAPQPQRRSMPVTAPVSRDVPTTSGQRQSTNQVHLSPEEVQIARSSFTDPTGKMTNADKERLYAMNKMKLARLRANGSYPSRERA